MTNNPKSMTGGEIEDRSENFVVHSVHAVTGFDFDEADPPVGMYLDLNDQLSVIFLGAGTNNRAVINLRILRPDGVIQPITIIPPANNSNVPAFSFFPLVEGFLLSLSVTTNAAVATFAPVFVQVGLARSPLNSQSIHTTLVAGYLNSGFPLGWPGSVPVRPTDTPGTYHSQTWGAPGAGADFSVTVPAGRRWRLVTATGLLTTAVAAANRFVSLVIDDGVNVVATIPSGVTLAASLTNNYTFGDSVSTEAPLNAASVTTAPSNLILTAGMRIRTVTANIQAADQWTLGQLLIGDWYDTL